ncbi:putative protein kinase RLK-Pelle-LRR-V family [Helianthus anomalus]
MSVRSYTIASLQQYTHGKFLAVKKLEKKVISQQTEEDFIELVSNLDKTRHANVVELMGYCSEHGQRSLIYEYCSSGSLHDALHSDDGYKKKISWNAGI